MKPEPPLVCVVDANVALKIFLVQPLSDRADALFERLADDARTRFFVPDFFYAECASAFANYVRLAGYPAANAQRDLTAVRALAFQVVPTTDLVEEALGIAVAQRISGYDACYVALSHRLGVPLITADEKLVRALAGKPFSIQALARFTIPPR